MNLLICRLIFYFLVLQLQLCTLHTLLLRNLLLYPFFLDGDNKEKITSIILNDDGRSDKPLVEKDKFKNGKYELIFYIGDYFKTITKLDQLQFLDDVVVRFGISNNKENYHVPLLVSPWSYSTYRGS